MRNAAPALGGIVTDGRWLYLSIILAKTSSREKPNRCGSFQLEKLSLAAGVGNSAVAIVLDTAIISDGDITGAVIILHLQRHYAVKPNAPSNFELGLQSF